MPRPPVKPQDRLRSAQACDSCKQSKKRCDARQPCGLCTRKGRSMSCCYSVARGHHPPLSARSLAAGSRRHAGSASQAEISERLIGEARPAMTDAGPIPGLCQTTQHGTVDCNNAVSQNTSTRASTPNAGQRAIMLLSSSGEKVFVGNTASLSFLRFLQTTLKHHIGPSRFVDSQDSRRLFEATSPSGSSATFSDDLPDDAKQALLQYFLDVSCGILDLFQPDELQGLLAMARLIRNGTSALSQGVDTGAVASLYLMIAIGAQCRGASEADLSCAARYFFHARKMAFEGMLENPTVNLVRAFLLMAFYMLGACRRNSAFMYMGVASKSADILGLHATAKQSHLEAAERDTRLRVATSLRVFDIICSSILGRPSCTMPLSGKDSRVGQSDQGTRSHRETALSAIYDACSVIETIVNKCTDDGRLDAKSAEEYLKTLRQWGHSLPDVLRRRHGSSKEPHHQGGPVDCRDMVIGNTHVAGVYYFGVILLTRQFLVDHIMPRIKGQLRMIPDSEAPAVAELSQACVDAAIFLGNICYEACEAGALGGNMCLIKAWLFAAGLVLGFFLLTDDEGVDQAREAFGRAIHVLGIQGRLSPQADQYHHILINFENAIKTYKDQAWRKRRDSKPSMVECILSLDPVAPVQEPAVAETNICNSHVLSTRESASCTSAAPCWISQDVEVSTSLSELFSGEWRPIGDDELMLRLLRDGYTADGGYQFPI